MFLVAGIVLTVPAAVAQQSYLHDESRVDTFETQFRRGIEGIGGISLRIPLTGTARTRQEAQPRLGLNIGVSNTRYPDKRWRRRPNGNVFEMGYTWSGDDYVSVIGKPRGYRSPLKARFKDSTSSRYQE